MKVIFLDIDGVLNSEKSLMEDNSLEDALILNLKALVEQTNAQIVLTSSWRLYFKTLYKVINKLAEKELCLYGLTPNGISLEWLKQQGYTPTERYLDSFLNYEGKQIKITTDRGAEILGWLCEHPEVKSFVILDDDIEDIKTYFPDNYVQTNFKYGLTNKDIHTAYKILYRKD